MARNLFDKFGNELWASEGRIYLKLAGSERVRFLGVVEGDRFRTFRKRAHRFNAMDSLGFNYHLMKYGKFCFVEVEFDTGEVIRTTREHVLQCGKRMMFRYQGFELQIFVPLSEFLEEVSI
jgi:hypothetical protein